eukprot:scaffold112337_cov69-Phaeocystis_antarctica.AAC.5
MLLLAGHSWLELSSYTSARWKQSPSTEETASSLAMREATWCVARVPSVRVGEGEGVRVGEVGLGFELGSAGPGDLRVTMYSCGTTPSAQIGLVTTPAAVPAGPAPTLATRSSSSRPNMEHFDRGCGRLCW